ncbi:MAG: GH25 family lysozyme [Hominimerdicola sp.]
MKKVKSHKRILTVTAVIISAVIVLSAVFLGLVYKKIIKLNNPEKNGYTVKGADVSAYQGEIDWNVLSEQIDFVFIKATEGAKYTDDCYDYNIENALKTDIKVGAYHFFSFESSGKAQAENFISNVEKQKNMLPPVIDVEFYGKFINEPAEKETVVENVRTMADILYEHYGKKPIIYCTGKAYNYYIKGNFDDCGLWLRNVYFNADRQTKDWDFWQYSDTEILDGYKGEEKYIDMNVFKGTIDELKNM